MEAGRLGVSKSAEPHSAYRFANAKSIAGGGGVSVDETFAVNKANTVHKSNAVNQGNANSQTIAGQASFSIKAGADAGQDTDALTRLRFNANLVGTKYQGLPGYKRGSYPAELLSFVE